MPQARRPLPAERRATISTAATAGTVVAMGVGTAAIAAGTIPSSAGCSVERKPQRRNASSAQSRADRTSRTDRSRPEARHDLLAAGARQPHGGHYRRQGPLPPPQGRNPAGAAQLIAGAPGAIDSLIADMMREHVHQQVVDPACEPDAERTRGAEELNGNYPGQSLDSRSR